MATGMREQGSGAESLSSGDRGRLASAAVLLASSSDERVRASARRLAQLGADDGETAVSDDGLDAVSKGDGPAGSIQRLSDELARLSKAQDEAGPEGAAALAAASRELQAEYLAQVSPNAAWAREEGIRHEAMRKAGINY
jgi:hypothetical protein